MIIAPQQIDTITSRSGELRLRFARRGGEISGGESAKDETFVAESYFHAPLQVMRPIRDSAGCLCVYLLSPTGGVVQGDEYQINIVVETGAHALFTTQAATKVYRMPRCGAVQIVNIEVHSGAVFEYLPDALILFKDADLTQEINVTLHPGALLILQEIVMPGRLARGEVLEFRRYTNRLTVRDDQGLILYENVRYEPETGDLTRLGLLDSCPCWGSWYAVGDLRGIDAAAFCETYQAALPDNDQAFAGLSTLYRSGIAARALGRSLAPIYAAFSALWQGVRSEALHLPATTLRK